MREYGNYFRHSSSRGPDQGSGHVEFRAKKAVKFVGTHRDWRQANRFFNLGWVPMPSEPADERLSVIAHRAQELLAPTGPGSVPLQSPTPSRYIGVNALGTSAGHGT